MITIYGIKNCDTMKKARAWLDKRSVAYVFHDYKTSGIDRGHLEAWSKKAGWEILLNKAGTTFQLPDKDKNALTERGAALMPQPSMIKRPVLDPGQAARGSRRRTTKSLSARTLMQVVMAGLSRPSTAYCYRSGKKNVDARHKAKHDEYVKRRDVTSRRNRWKSV